MGENTSPQSTALLFLHAQTSLHPGAGTALGTVDLPVQRERHTQWPVVPGSALKGILRDRCREAVRAELGADRRQANDDAELTAVFGPGKAEESSTHAGALSVTDARILAFPVRSAKGVFAWVTCPAVLGRLARDLSLVSHESISVPQVRGDTNALVPGDSPLVLLPDNKLVLEEFEFSTSGPMPSDLADWIASHAIHAEDAFTPARIRSHLIVLHDDWFTHFVRNATEVVARIGLDYDTKTVKNGALFYQEFLPPETLFYALVLAHGSRRNGDVRTSHDILKYVRERVPDGSVLQIGGDETIGKGICSVRIVGQGR